jgi:hypothetical protein
MAAVQKMQWVEKYGFLVTRGNQNDFIDDFISHLKNAVFWDVTPCGSCKKGRFGVT